MRRENNTQAKNDGIFFFFFEEEKAGEENGERYERKQTMILLIANWRRIWDQYCGCGVMVRSASEEDRYQDMAHLTE